MTIPTVDHIKRLWDILSRPPDQEIEGSSCIPLPFPYIVPGGRFREIFYWDSYFTMLGLSVCPERFCLIESMIDNFAYLIDSFGFIPNGNRTYFLSRSQPPFFASMIQLLSDLSEDRSSIWRKYLPQLEKEYHFWMRGKDQLPENHMFHQVCVSAVQILSHLKNVQLQHVVRLANGTILNRYWDPLTTPRPESFPKEMDECEKAQAIFGVDEETFYMHNRAACESGWDFSSRWFKDGRSKAANRAAHLIPVDLNCLIHFLETLLASIYAEQNDDQSLQLSKRFEELADIRKQAIQTTFWSDESGFFMDYDPIDCCCTSILSLAGVYPLFFNIATEEQAASVHQRLKNDFLQQGGLQTTLQRTGQQWDSPIGWAPLQWIAYTALRNYGFHPLANEIRFRWLNLNDQVYRQTGKMMEKYNVVDRIEGGGGNYPLQDGFGWTNGVYLRLFYESDE